MPTDRGSASVRVKIDRQCAGPSCARTSVVRCAGGAGGCRTAGGAGRCMCRAAEMRASTGQNGDAPVTVAAQDICKYIVWSYTSACIKTMDETALKKGRSPLREREMTKELTGDCTDRPPVTSHVTCPKLRSAPRGQPRACCHGGRASARARTSDKVTSSVVFGLRVLRLPGGAHTSPRSA